MALRIAFPMRRTKTRPVCDLTQHSVHVEIFTQMCISDEGACNVEANVHKFFSGLFPVLSRELAIYTDCIMILFTSIVNYFWSKCRETAFLIEWHADEVWHFENETAIL